ncbi:MAG TPA: hypothetical protein PL152_00585 [Steroidobacteraceae bacterium]|nr:hypothetical protein [Steroidobacteraceae bacterium]HQR47795.1 hypothetical protein [Steroidobacteraceae bacterium]
MFTRIAPQRARDTDGAIVQVGSRDRIEYARGEITAVLDADFALVTGIYPDSLTIRKAGGALATISDEEREAIFCKIKEGLDCLGIRYEECRRGSQGRPPSDT